MTNVTDTDDLCGAMEHITLEAGRKTNEMAKDASTTPTVTWNKVNGKTANSFKKNQSTKSSKVNLSRQVRTLKNSVAWTPST